MALGVGNVVKFTWPARPPAESLIRAVEGLYAWGAVDGDGRCGKAGGGGEGCVESGWTWMGIDGWLNFVLINYLIDSLMD